MAFSRPASTPVPFCSSCALVNPVPCSHVSLCPFYLLFPFWNALPCILYIDIFYTPRRRLPLSSEPPLTRPLYFQAELLSLLCAPVAVYVFQNVTRLTVESVVLKKKYIEWFVESHRE